MVLSNIDLPAVSNSLFACVIKLKEQGKIFRRLKLFYKEHVFKIGTTQNFSDFIFKLIKPLTTKDELSCHMNLDPFYGPGPQGPQG